MYKKYSHQIISGYVHIMGSYTGDVQHLVGERVWGYEKIYTKIKFFDRHHLQMTPMRTSSTREKVIGMSRSLTFLFIYP